MKNFKFLSLMFLFLTLLACAPERDETKDLANKNNKELQELREKLSELKERNDELELKQQSGLTTDEKKELESLRPTIDELRSDLLRYFKQEFSALENRITDLENNFDNFKITLNQIESNYVKLEDFTALKKEMDDRFKTEKESLIEATQTSNISSEELALLNKKLEELEKKQTSFEVEYKDYYTKAISAWSKKLVEYINAQDKEIEKKLKTFVRDEVGRLKIEIETNTNKISKLNTKLAQNFTRLSEEERQNIQQQMNLLQSQIQRSNELLNNIKVETAKANMPEVFTDIIEKQFAPCLNGLKNNKACFTLGTLIQRLGGTFIDSSKFEQSIDGLKEFFLVSGIKLNYMLKKRKIEAFVKPDTRSITHGMTYAQHFKTCHPNKDYLIPPKEQWPRAVLLALILQRIEEHLSKQKELGLVDNKVQPVTGLAAWYRTKCYQNRIKGVDTENIPEKDWPKAGDHIYAAAFDLSFRDHAGKLKTDTHKFYVDYVRRYVVELDIFEISKPLRNAGLTFNLGFGHGKNNRLHMGVGSGQHRHNPVFARY